MVIFGGTDDRAYFSDVVVLDLCSMAWLNPQCSGARPKGRALHASVVFNDFLIVHGGLSIENMECLTGSPKENLYSYGDIVSNAYLNDLRVLDLNTFVWSRLRTHGTPCSPRYGHSYGCTVWPARCYILWWLVSCSEVPLVEGLNGVAISTR